jgi:hypothetical protein
MAERSQSTLLDAMIQATRPETVMIVAVMAVT